MVPTVNGHISHWFDKMPSPRTSLPGDRDADVCIVGAGFTGLWTAYYLKRADPSLRIAILEARFAGFGASGRNGGWLSGMAPGDRHAMARDRGRDAVVAWQQALIETIDEVVDVASREGIDAGIVKGGTLQIARNPAQAERLAERLVEERSWGVTGYQELTTAEAAQRVRFSKVVAAYHSPHCARIQPAALARGLADVVEGLGVDVYEQSPVTEIVAGRAITPRGTVRAPIVLRATEGFTAGLPGLKRRWLPMNSSLIATEPIDAKVWDSVGWDGRETVGDMAHGFFYAQRTVDDRIAIGGRSVPYRYASRTDVDGRVPQRTIRQLTDVLHDVLPQVRDVPIAHGWCGVLAVPRDWSAGSTWIVRRGSAGRVATSGTASRRRTSPVGRWRIWCWGRTRPERSCRGSGTGPRDGSRSRCGGSASAVSTSPTGSPTGRSSVAAQARRPSPRSPTGSRASPRQKRAKPRLAP